VNLRLTVGKAFSLLNKILIIEDERDVVDLLTLNLKRAGNFVVTEALDGATGLQKARAELPQLILLDLMLPEMPGLEVCKVLKTDRTTRHIPIIILSAKAEEIDRIVELHYQLHLILGDLCLASAKHNGEVRSG